MAGPDAPVRPPIRYLREPMAIHFPIAAEMPETAVHLRLRTALFLLLEGRLRGRAFIGSDQFVYWNPTDPRACLAPDAFVRMGGPLTLPPSFKTWEHGAPHVAVEIISRGDARDAVQEEKLLRYRQCGIGEVVFFDPADHARPLRLWDLVEGEHVERDLVSPGAMRCSALDAYWQVEPDAELGLTLRLSDDPEGKQPWLTPVEAERAKAEAERAKGDEERNAKERALARVAELEAELARRG